MRLRVLLLAVVSMLFVGNVPAGEVKTATQFVKDYGGSLAAYEEILKMTDCAKLQEQFDTAAGNNDRARPGTKAFRWTMGYMEAADNRMRAIGCYND